MPDTLIDLIRHGEPRGGKRFRGNGADDPLSPLGWAQMESALAGPAPWAQVISSPLTRCRVFAAELAGRHGLPLAVEPALMEIGMGSWEGRTHEEVEESEPAAYRAIHLDPVGHRPPGGESLEAFRHRVSGAYERQVAAFPGRHILIVCHGGVMRAVAGHLLGASPARWYRLRIDFAGLLRVRHGRFGPAIECLNVPRLPRQPVGPSVRHPGNGQEAIALGGPARTQERAGQSAVSGLA
jgi:probable phosphoglycerate mutase